MNYKFKKINIAESTPSENNFINIISVIIIGGSIVGILSGYLMVMFISMVVGAISIFIFNKITNGKFQVNNAISNNEFISFTEELLIINNEELKWIELKHIKINIVTYKGMLRSRGIDMGDTSTYYDGIEYNHIEFEKSGESQRVDFFIENKESFDFLNAFFSKKLPKLCPIKNIKYES